MARPLRSEMTGGRYHVTARGNEGKPIYRADGDRWHLLELLSELPSAAPVWPATGTRPDGAPNAGVGVHIVKCYDPTPIPHQFPTLLFFTPEIFLGVGIAFRS